MKTLDQLKNIGQTISVGVLTADIMNLTAELESIEAAGIKLLHFDIMDGHVWPNITIGPSFVKGVKSSMLNDVHLLIDKPENHIEAFAKAGADMIVFAVESCGDIGKTLRAIGEMENANDPDRGILRGVSLNPETPIDVISSVIDDVDIVELLAVSPDAPGENFISQLPVRIAQVKKIKDDVLIFVDGGIKKNNIAEVAAMGPDVIITGSAVFDGKTPKENAEFMLEAIGK
ncbi:ribulose-phosphate 3-epimerase [Planctomycetota bacterium]